MDEETRKQLEYEEQFYGISSQFFVDSFKNFIKSEITAKIEMLVSDFRNKIISQTSNVEKFNLGLKEMKESLLNEYFQSLENTFDENKCIISKILNIPSNVLLKEDLPLSAGFNGSIDKLREEIENLKGTLMALLFIKQTLHEELRDADSTIIFMEKFASDKNFDFKILEADKICEQSRVISSSIENF